MSLPDNSPASPPSRPSSTHRIPAPIDRTNQLSGKSPVWLIPASTSPHLHDHHTATPVNQSTEGWFLSHLPHHDTIHHYHPSYYMLRQSLATRRKPITVAPNPLTDSLLALNIRKKLGCSPCLVNEGTRPHVAITTTGPSSAVVLLASV